MSPLVQFAPRPTDVTPARTVRGRMGTVTTSKTNKNKKTNNKMVTLNTLRNKGGVLLAVFIGFALLAFVLGDLLTSGSTLLGNSKMNVGKINGEKIPMQLYAQTIDELTEIQRITTGRESSNDEQSEMLRNQAWEMLIREKAFNPEVARLGLVTGEDELIDLVNGANPSPIIAQMFANPQTGGVDREYLRSFVAQVNQDQSGRLQMFWGYLQQEVKDQSLVFKFKNLVDKAVYVTTFEADQMATLQSNDYNIRFVAGRYDAIADSTVKVTDAELRTYYDKNKQTFTQEDVREIEYVTYEALPSESDYTAAATVATQLAADLATAPNVQQYVTLNSSTPFDARYYKEGELTGDLAGFAFTATGDQIYGPIQNGDQWTMTRVADVQIIPDSIRLSHIALSTDQTAKADSLAAVLAKGGDFAAAAVAYSLDPAAATNGGDQGMLDPQSMAPQFAEALKGATVGTVKVVNAGESIHVLKVTGQTTPARKVQLGTINYNIEASEATRNEIYGKANKFATTATSNFDAAVKDNALAKRVATVGSNDRTVGGIQQSRELARWSWNGDKNDVSGVMEFGNTFVIATITAVRQKGVASFEQAKETVRQMVVNQKKAEIITAKLKDATTIEAMATALGGRVIESNDVNFQSFMAPEVGFDPALVGGVTATKAGSLSKPIVGRIGVYVAQVVSETENPIAPEIEKARLSAEATQSAFMSAYQAFLEMSRIEDTRYRFY